MTTTTEEEEEKGGCWRQVQGASRRRPSVGPSRTCTARTGCSSLLDLPPTTRASARLPCTGRLRACLVKEEGGREGGGGLRRRRPSRRRSGRQPRSTTARTGTAKGNAP